MPRPLHILIDFAAWTLCSFLMAWLLAPIVLPVVVACMGR
jgi:hypothetical protein